MNLKTIFISTTAMLLIALPLCLIAGQKDNTKIPSLTWRDAETKHVLFTSHDIIAFDWDKQVFLLERDAILDFLAWIPQHMLQYRKLVVEDAKRPIYEAHWVNFISSMGFVGPIYTPLSPNPFFSIRNGYPGRENPIARNKDPRFAPRLKAGLEKAGKLQTIDLRRKYLGLIIQPVMPIGQPWKNVGEDMKIRIEYFENTFRFGDEARAHVFYAGGEKTRKQIDSLRFNVTLIANKGTFRSDIISEGIPISEIEDGIYVYKFFPWQPVEGSDEKINPGTGMVSFAILLQKQNKTVYRLDFTECHVNIGGKMMSEQKNPPNTK